MNKQKLNELLDSVYELEGLIHLALNRDDIPDHLLSLITGKGKKIAIASTLMEEELQQIETGSDTYAIEEIHAEENTPVIAEEKITEEVEEEEAPMILAPLGVPAEVPELPSEGSAPEEEARVMAAVDAPVLEIESEELREKVVDELAGAEETAMEEIVEDIAKASLAKTEPRGRLVFTLNDKFRFKRELFGNSDAAFNDTLAYVATLDNYVEAEDYFLTELQWNPEREEVKEFFEILKKYFK